MLIALTIQEVDDKYDLVHCIVSIYGSRIEIKYPVIHPLQWHDK